MAETVETSNFDELKGTDCVFVADWLKIKGPHSCVPYLKVFLYYINMCCLMNHVYMHSFRSIIKATEKFLVIFPGVGAFEQLFGPVRGEFSKNFPKIQMPGGLLGRGGGC